MSQVCSVVPGSLQRGKGQSSTWSLVRRDTIGQRLVTTAQFQLEAEIDLEFEVVTASMARVAARRGDALFELLDLEAPLVLVRFLFRLHWNLHYW
jgi:hypothetical protein